MPYCKKCGAELQKDANFCAKCGTPVAREDTMPTNQHQTFKIVGKPKVVLVNRAPGKVDVKSSVEGEVTVDLDLREPEDLECSISQDANTVTVRCRALVHPFRWTHYFTSGGPRANISVLVPKETDLDLEVSLDQVNVTGIKGELKVETSVARINLENVEGKVDVKGRTGTIELKNVNGTIAADNTTGPVIMENVNGTVSVHNTTGPIRFSGGLSGENRFRTTTGSVELSLTGKPDLTVEAYSRLGSVTCIPVPADWRYERGQYRGHFGSGTGKLIVETTTGSIAMRQ
jgi:DUF4097 and DUF4098 domain-containing protein YvlB